MYKDSLFILLIILTLMAAILLFAGNYFYNFSILRKEGMDAAAKAVDVHYSVL
ncbi:MAG: hypothetical protein K0R80_979 [Clostridia bacterium]|nr:hypothetical protein [Clostridia bacterium]